MLKVIEKFRALASRRGSILVLAVGLILGLTAFFSAGSFMVLGVRTIRPRLSAKA